jgi:hypothetical protein
MFCPFFPLTKIYLILKGGGRNFLFRQNIIILSFLNLKNENIFENIKKLNLNLKNKIFIIKIFKFKF